MRVVDDPASFHGTLKSTSQHPLAVDVDVVDGRLHTVPELTQNFAARAAC